MRYKGIDLHLIVVLDALLRHQNVSRAAMDLNLTQPTVSNALARLRQHYDDELLVMVGRQMAPTALALGLREPVAEMLRQMQCLSGMRQQFDPATCTLGFTLVCSDYVAQTLVTRLGQGLAQQAPLASLGVMAITEQTIDSFNRGGVDLLIAPRRMFETRALHAPLFQDRFVPIIWAGNTEIGDTITLDGYFAARHVIAEFGDTSKPSLMEEFLAPLGRKRQIAMRLPNFAALADFVVGTPCIATVPRNFALKKQQEVPIRLLEAEFPMPHLHESLFWPPHLENDRASMWLRQLVMATCGDDGSDTR